jgi:hypothetical protein
VVQSTIQGTRRAIDGTLTVPYIHIVYTYLHCNLYRETDLRNPHLHQAHLIQLERCDATARCPYVHMRYGIRPYMACNVRTDELYAGASTTVCARHVIHSFVDDALHYTMRLSAYR